MAIAKDDRTVERMYSAGNTETFPHRMDAGKNLGADSEQRHVAGRPEESLDYVIGLIGSRDLVGEELDQPERHRPADHLPAWHSKLAFSS